MGRGGGGDEKGESVAGFSTQGYKGFGVGGVSTGIGGYGCEGKGGAATTDGRGGGAGAALAGRDVRETGR